MRVLGMIVLIGIVIVGGVFLYLDRILKIAIERGAEYALGVETSVGSVRPGLLSGRLALSDLTVSNPQGFDTPHFLRLGDAAVGVGLRSLRTDTVEVSEVRFEGIEMYLERKPGVGTNYGTILERIGKTGTQPSAEPSAAEQSAGESGPSLVIRELTIRDVAARLRLAPELGKAATLDVEIPEIRLRNVGAQQGGVDVAQLSSLVVRAILDAVLRKGGDLGAIGRDLEARLRGLGTVRGDVVGSVKRLREAPLEEGAKEALRGLGGLLKKKDGD